MSLIFMGSLSLVPGETKLTETTVEEEEALKSRLTLNGL